ncbi:glycosyltransferase family 9 protein, partial [bacterium]|nr:glycosyltransferase family 9 protein [bacterium]
MEYLFLAMSSAVSALVNALHLCGRRAVRHAVVFKLDRLGDLVTAAPAIAAIRHRHPDAELTLVVGSWCAELANSLLPVDLVAVYDSPRFVKALADEKGRASRGLKGTLDRRTYDVAYGLREDTAVLSFCLSGGCRRRRDRGTVRVGDWVRRFGAVLKGRGDPGPLGELETNLRIAGVATAGAAALPSLTASPDEVARVSADILGENRPASAPLVVIHPGAAWVHRQWPVERYSELVTRLCAEYRATVVVTGSAEERELADRVLAGGAQGRSVAGEYDIGQVAALLSLADVYIGSDT